MLAEYLLAGEPFFHPDRNKPRNRPSRRETRSVWQLITSWLFTPKEPIAHMCREFRGLPVIQMKSLPPREERAAVGLHEEEEEAGLGEQEANQMAHAAEKMDGYADHLIFDLDLDNPSSSPSEDFSSPSEDDPFFGLIEDLSREAELRWDDPLLRQLGLQKLVPRHVRAHDSKLRIERSKDEFPAMVELPDAPWAVCHKDNDLIGSGLNMEAQLRNDHPDKPHMCAMSSHPFVEDVRTAPQYGARSL